MPNFLVLAEPWKEKQPAGIFWLYEIAAQNQGEAGAIAMRCAEIGAALDGLTAPTRVLVADAYSEQARKWEGKYDTWPSDYCAGIAARYGLAKEAGK